MTFCIATVIIGGVIWFMYSERKFDEREAQKDINELINKGYTNQEAEYLVLNAVDDITSLDKANRVYKKR